MRHLLNLTLLVALAGCGANGTLSPAATTQVQAFCAKDPALFAAGQVAAAVVPVQGVNSAATADALLVHPLVIDACAKLGMVPVAPTGTPAVTVPAK